jgi:hypothetical protein
VDALAQAQTGALVRGEQQLDLVGVGHADQRSRRRGRIKENPPAEIG